MTSLSSLTFAEVEYNKLQENYVNKVPHDSTVFFTVPNVTPWRLQNIDDRMVAVICMSKH